MKGKVLFLFLFSFGLSKANLDFCVWSDWIDNDDPGGNGDYEGSLPCDDAIAIQARRVNSTQFLKVDVV